MNNFECWISPRFTAIAKNVSIVFVSLYYSLSVLCSFSDFRVAFSLLCNVLHNLFTS